MSGRDRGRRRRAHAEPGTRPRRSSLTRLAPALVVLLAIAHIASLRFVCDDAFISYRYAANLAHGHGLVYNAGQRVEGYSNFLWTLIATAVIALGGQPEAVLPWLSALAALATLVLVIRAARARGLDPLLAGLLLAANTGFAAWATGGLETALFTALVTAGSLACLAGAPVPGALMLGLAALTRPEGLLVAGCAGAFLLVDALRGRLAWRAWGAWLGGIAACVVPHLLWRRAYYGQWLPHSFAVKEPGLALVRTGAHYLLDAVVHLRLWVLAIPIVAAPFVRRDSPWSARDARFVAAIALPFLAFVCSTGGDFMPAYRFVVPLVPLLALAAGATLDALARALAQRLPRVPRVAWAAVLLVPYLALGLLSAIREQGVWFRGSVSSVGASRLETEQWGRVGDYLRQTRARTDTLAITAAGIIPYRSGLVTLDMLGLNDPELARFRRRPSGMPGHRLYIRSDSLLALAPQVLLGQPYFESKSKNLAPSLDLEPEWRERMLTRYTVVGYQLEGLPRLYSGLFLRDDVVARDTLAGLPLLFIRQ